MPHRTETPPAEIKHWFDLSEENLMDALERTLEAAGEHREALQFGEAKDALLKIAPDTQVIPGQSMTAKLTALEAAREAERDRGGSGTYIDLQYGVAKEYNGHPDVQAIHARKYVGEPDEDVKRRQAARRAYVRDAKATKRSALGKMLST